jgi:hypothetical protein
VPRFSLRQAGWAEQDETGVSRFLLWSEADPASRVEGENLDMATFLRVLGGRMSSDAVVSAVW